MKKGYKLLIFLIMFIVLPVSVKAEVSFSVSKSADNLKPGSNLTVAVKSSGVNEVNSLAEYNLRLGFDTSKLQYISGGAVSGNNVTISGKGNPTIQQDVGVNINFKVVDGAGSGNALFSLSGTYNVNDDVFNCNSNSCKGTQVKIISLGTDASLSSLKIPNATLKPGFSSDVTSYTATIQDITDLDVNAVPSDSNAKVSVSDNHRALQKGENKVDIVVVSEDGNNKRVYSVVVTLNLTPTEAELLKANATLKSLSIKGQKIDFDSNEKKYYLTVPYTVKKLILTPTPANPKAKVEIDGDKKLIVGKNTVKITVVSEDKTKIENYQIIVTREDQEKEIVQTCPDVTSTKEWIFFSLATLLTFTLGIVLGYFLCKKDIFRKIFTKKEKKEEPVEIETLSDTIDLSDTVKKVKKNSNKSKK